MTFCEVEVAQIEIETSQVNISLSVTVLHRREIDLRKVEIQVGVIPDII